VTDREKYGLRGAVHSLRHEFAELDFATEQWQPPRHYSVTVFLRDGRLDQTETHNPDGSVVQSVYLYDGAGRLVEIRSGDSAWTNHYDDLGRIARVTGPSGDRERVRYEADGRHMRIQLVPPEFQARNTLFSCGVEGSEHSYNAQGTVEVHTLFDTVGRAVEMQFLNAAGGLLNRVVCTYDSEGRLLREAQIPGGALQLRDRLLMRMAGLGGEMSSVEYQYDSEGQRIAADRCLGKVMNERMTWRYDQSGNKIEETHDETKHELAMGLTGMKSVKESRSRHSVRFEYQYDEQGNWTEQVVSTRPEPNPNFQRQNIQRRVLTYWG
jgi:YD repeat-containing protein